MRTSLCQGGFLAPGDHRFTWRALERTFAFNDHRVRLLEMTRIFLRDLERRFDFVGRVYIGGSFVTQKPMPGDVDVVLDCKSMAAPLYALLGRAVIADGQKWHDDYGVDVYVALPMHTFDVRDTLRLRRDCASAEGRKGLAVIAASRRRICKAV